MLCRHYSPYLPTDYATPYRNYRLGIGALGLWRERPALWNLYWLTYRDVDALLGWTDSPNRIPVWTTAVPTVERAGDLPLDGATVATWFSAAAPGEALRAVARAPEEWAACGLGDAKTWGARARRRLKAAGVSLEAPPGTDPCAIDWSTYGRLRTTGEGSR